MDIERHGNLRHLNELLEGAVEPVPTFSGSYGEGYTSVKSLIRTLKNFERFGRSCGIKKKTRVNIYSSSETLGSKHEVPAAAFVALLCVAGGVNPLRSSSPIAKFALKYRRPQLGLACMPASRT